MLLRSGVVENPRRTAHAMAAEPHDRNSPPPCFPGRGHLDATANTRGEIWQLQPAARKFESTVPYFTGVPVVRFSGLRSSRGVGNVVQQVHEHLKMDCAPRVTALCLGHKISLSAIRPRSLQ
jgi:hypothetical protein